MRGRVTGPLLWAAALGAAQLYGVSLTTGSIAPASLRYDRLIPVARVSGPRCFAGNSLVGCVPACHQWLPWFWATFVTVSDAAWPGLDQSPSSTAPATGPVGRLGRPSASDPGGVDRCVLSLCCPRCMCVCGVLAHLASVHRCARCVRFACAVGGCVPPPPPLILFPFILLCVCFVCFAFLLFEKREGGASTLQEQAWATGAALL